MLHYCSVADIKSVMQSAARHDANYTMVRDAVTDDMNAYVRRDLEYVAGYVEFFDSTNVEWGGRTVLWLEKKNIEGDVTIEYNPRREWGLDENVINPVNVMLNRTKGRVEFIGVTRRYLSSLRVAYSGGFKPRMDDPTIMDCPARLKEAAIGECVYRLDKLLNINVGNKEEVDRKQVVTQQVFIGNLLSVTANALQQYRKPLG